MIDCIKIYYAQIPDKPLNITINKARRDTSILLRTRLQKRKDIGRRFCLKRPLLIATLTLKPVSLN